MGVVGCLVVVLVVVLVIVWVLLMCCMSAVGYCAGYVSYRSGGGVVATVVGMEVMDPPQG
jgi:hypothetical protein